MKNRIMIFLLITATLFSCKEEEEPQLNLTRRSYAGTMRTDGYYYHDFDNGSARKLIYILYRDGVVLYGGAPTNEALAEREVEFSNGRYAAAAAPEKTFWGLFKVEGNTITFNQWHVRDGAALAQYTTTGTLLSDTTFLMSSTDRNGVIGEAIDELYRFKAAVKPDSTNQFLN